MNDMTIVYIVSSFGLMLFIGQVVISIIILKSLKKNHDNSIISQNDQTQKLLQSLTTSNTNLLTLIEKIKESNNTFTELSTYIPHIYSGISNLSETYSVNMIEKIGEVLKNIKTSQDDSDQKIIAKLDELINKQLSTQSEISKLTSTLEQSIENLKNSLDEHLTF